MRETKERYLGDGLYASFDGWQFALRAPRAPLGEDHVVYLDPYVFQALLDYKEELARAWHQPEAKDGE